MLLLAGVTYASSTLFKIRLCLIQCLPLLSEKGAQMDVDDHVVKYEEAVAALGRRNMGTWWKLRAFEYTRKTGR